MLMNFTYHIPADCSGTRTTPDPFERALRSAIVAPLTECPPNSTSSPGAAYPSTMVRTSSVSPVLSAYGLASGRSSAG